jgi:SagB-type dehydrogenase family enzyme
MFLRKPLLTSDQTPLPLPRPDTTGSTTVEQALLNRRSIRDFSDDTLSIVQVAQLLWAAQGTTSDGKRTAPSAGALYPLNLYAVVGRVHGLDSGVYRYKSREHGLVKTVEGDRRNKLSTAAWLQPSVKRAPLVLVFTGVYARTGRKYGDRGKRYVHMEVGHAAQNVYLQAVSMQLVTVVVGAFHDVSVRSVLGIPKVEVPFCLMPVGRATTLD